MVLAVFDENQDASKFLLQLDVFLNTTTAGLGVWIFALRPVLDAAVAERYQLGSNEKVPITQQSKFSPEGVAAPIVRFSPVRTEEYGDEAEPIWSPVLHQKDQNNDGMKLVFDRIVREDKSRDAPQALTSAGVGIESSEAEKAKGEQKDRSARKEKHKKLRTGKNKVKGYNESEEPSADSSNSLESVSNSVGSGRTKEKLLKKAHANNKAKRKAPRSTKDKCLE